MDCTIHPNAAGADGYVVVRYQGRSVRAHRLAYAQANGLDPFSMGGAVLHTCDTPKCVNPEHLRLGTWAENAADRDRKGRQARILTDDQIRELRRRYVPRCKVNGGAAMSRELGVTQTTVSEAVREHSFRQVGEV